MTLFHERKLLQESKKKLKDYFKKKATDKDLEVTAIVKKKLYTKRKIS